MYKATNRRFALGICLLSDCSLSCPLPPCSLHAFEDFVGSPFGSPGLCDGGGDPRASSVLARVGMGTSSLPPGRELPLVAMLSRITRRLFPDLLVPEPEFPWSRSLHDSHDA